MVNYQSNTFASSAAWFDYPLYPPLSEYLPPILLKSKLFGQESGNAFNMWGVGAADKAAIQRVKVPPYQLPVSDT